MSKYPFRVDLRWDHQGHVRWEQDWVQDVGHTRSRVPGLDDHISFANYDLTREGLPLVQRDSEGVFLEIESSSESATPEKAGIPDVFWSSALRIMPVLAYHGFALAPKSD